MINSKKLLYWMFYKDYYNFLALITVLANKRKIGRLVVSEKKAKIMKKYLDQKKIYYEEIPRSKTADGFIFEGGKNEYICNEQDLKFCKENNLYLYISKDKNLIEELKNSEIRGDPATTGKLLAYPGCCIEKHIIEIKNKNISDKSIINNLIKTNTKKNKFKFYTNCNSFGRTLIPHFPCSLECQQSIKMGKENLELIKKISKNFEEYIIFCLTRPTFFAKEFIIKFNMKKPEYNKIYQIDKKEFTIEGITAKTIKLIDKNKIILDNETFEGNLIFFN